MSNWLTLDEAAAALGVGERQARKLAHANQWNTLTHPTRYALLDVQKTARQRLNRPGRPKAPTALAGGRDTPKETSMHEGA